MNTNISRDFQICISIPWIRSHERWYEIKPVGDFKPAWKQVLLGTTLIGEVSLETNDVKSYYTMLTEQTSKYFLRIPQTHWFHKNFNKTAFCEDFDYMNLTKVTSIFKSEKIVFCFLPCFSKILERILCNRIYKYLTKRICCLINNLNLEEAIQPNLQWKTENKYKLECL